MLVKPAPERVVEIVVVVVVGIGCGGLFCCGGLLVVVDEVDLTELCVLDDVVEILIEDDSDEVSTIVDILLDVGVVLSWIASVIDEDIKLESLEVVEV